MWGWVKVRSWHRVKTATRVPDSYITFCGKHVTGQAQDSFPPSEKTCESCWRISNPVKESA